MVIGVVPQVAGYRSRLQPQVSPTVASSGTSLVEGEAVHRPTQPGHLEQIAFAVVALQAALHGPAEVILDRH